MKPTSCALVGVSLLALASTATGGRAIAQEGLKYVTYVDQASGVSVSYPVNVFTRVGAGKDRGGFVRFVSDDGLASFFLHGVGNPDRKTIDRLAAEAEESFSQEGATVTYRRKKAGWSVISGFISDQIFYRRTILVKDGAEIGVLQINFPREQKPFYYDIVSRMSWSFKEAPKTRISAQ